MRLLLIMNHPSSATLRFFSGLLLLVFSSNLWANPLSFSPDSIHPIHVGDTLPKIKLLSTNGDSIGLREAGKGKPSIFIFYRGGWCPYCNRQLGELSGAEDKLFELGYKIFAVSPDKPEYLKESKQKNKLKINFLSDSDALAAIALGIAFRVDSATVKKYKGWDMDIEKNSGRSHHILPVPSVFLADKSGVVRFSFINPDYKVRLSPDTLLKIAKDNVSP